MAEKPDATGAPTVIELLKEELAAAEDHASQAEENIAAAKAEATAAKANLKRLQSALQLLSGESVHSSASPTKDSVRPLLTKVLANGPLEESELTDRLHKELLQNGFSKSGLGLVLRHMKSEFGGDQDNRWALPTASVHSSSIGATADQTGGVQ